MKKLSGNWVMFMIGVAILAAAALPNLLGR